MAFAERSGSGDGTATCGFTIDPERPETWPPWITGDSELLDSDALPDCEHDVLDGFDRCGLHLPIDERPEEFDPGAAIAARLEAVADPNRITRGDATTVDLAGIIVEDLSLDEFDGELDPETVTAIDLRFATITGTLAVDGATCEQSLDLSGATVGRFSASGTAFTREVALSAARIGAFPETERSTGTREAVMAPRATFEDRLELDGATVTGNVTLANVDPLETLVLEAAEVRGIVMLDGADVRTTTGLGDLSCRSLTAIDATLANVDMTDLSVAEEANFTGTEFSSRQRGADGEIKLPEARFDGPAVFDAAVFDATANLRKVTATAEVSLEGARFNDSVRAQSLEFHDATRAEGVTVAGSLDCENSTFAGVLDCDRGTFHGPVAFDDARFGGLVSFENATFEATAAFDGAEFTGDCLFRATVRSDPASDGSSPDGADDAPESGVFNGDVSFIGAEIKGRGDFRVLARPHAAERTDAADSDQDRLAGTEIVEEATTVGGTFDGRESRLVNANLAGLRAAGTITFDGADLSEANLRQANLDGASIEQARLSHANLFAADLSGARLHGTVFEGTRIDQHTELGTDICYADLPASASRHQRQARLTKAESLASQLETLARDNGQGEKARKMFIERKDANLRQKFDAEAGNKLLGAASPPFLLGLLKKIVMGYGENYLRVVVSSLAIIGIFGALYPLSGLSHQTAGQIVYGPSPAAIVGGFSMGVLYSMSAFTALGVAGFEPGPLAEILAAFEAGVGIIMFGLFLFVLQRRTVR